MIDRLHIKRELKELEGRIEYLVRKDKIVSKTEEIQQFHIFFLKNTLFAIPNYTADKEEYLNGSFLQYLKPNYYKISPQRLWQKRKNYLDTSTYIMDIKGNLIATGDARLVSIAFASYSLMIKTAKFLLEKKFDFVFYMGGIYGYFITIKEGKLYVINTFGGEIEVYEWEYFVNNCLDKIVPS
ncbi:hypothetical protein [Capnocytophaga sputigena]|uniref:hypothetical protein n=1 Tax=Capnocytophaga sputigena TaxID=1019 RepID=UPI00288B4C24|nr:hypothetical protein [Capnocytophaga sputigena]